MKKRLLATLLVLVMLLGMIPVIAGAESATPQITGTQLVLDSILSLNITADLADESTADYAVYVTIGDDTAAQVLSSDNGTYTAKLLAHRMHESVKVELVKSGEVKDTKTWTLANYLAYIRENNGDNGELIALVNALSDYGSYAAYYADNSKGDPAVEAVTAVTAEKLGNYKLDIQTANTALKATANLYLDEACDLTFKFDAAAMEGKTLYINGEQKDTVDMGNGKVGYSILEILPQDYDILHNVTVKDGDSVVYELNYGVLSYVLQNLKRTEELKTGLNGLLASMYLYNVAADAFLAAQNKGEYVKLADSFLVLAPTSASAEGLPANASISNTYTCGWTSTNIAEGIELEKYSELMFYVKTSDENKWFELYDAGSEQLFATNSSQWVKVELILEGEVWTMYVDGQWRLSNLSGATLAELLPSVVLGGSVNADVYITDLMAIKNPNYVDPYALIIANILPVAGEAADNVAQDYENSTKLNIGWTANGVAFAEQDLAPYKALKFVIQSTAWHGVSLGGTTIAQHSGNMWVEYLFVKNGDTWSFTFNGEQQAAVTMSDLSDLTFLTGGSDIYYVSELRAMADPDYVPPAPPAYITLPGNPFTKDGEVTTEESLEGFETVTKLTTSWNKYDFRSVDIAPYSQVEFAVKSSGWYGLMPDASTVINETNGGGNWLTIKLVKNGDAWDVYYGDNLEQTVTLASNNIADLNFRFGDNTYYVTNLRAIADPNYVPMVYVTVADSIFDISGTASTETIDGYETITALTTSWNRYNFKDFDLTPYIRVKFAVKSSGWYGLMPDANTVINESTGTIEIELIKNGDVWAVYYNGTYQQDVTLPGNNLTDLYFRFGGNTYHVSELKAVCDPNYVAPKVGIIEMDPFTLYGTAAPEESVDGYSFVTALTTSWNKYNFVSVDLTNYTEVWFSVKSAGYYGVMNGDSVINETNGGGNWLEIKLVKNGANWDVYYGGALQQSVTLANNNLTDLNFRFGSNTYYVTELMGLESTENPYVSTYVQVAPNFINSTPTSTTAEGLTSRDVSVINITNCGWASPGVVDGINMADYTELKFWYKVSDSGKWFEMFNSDGAFYQGNATAWTEMKFVLESNGTWTFYADGEGKKWGLTGETLKDMIVTLTLGGSETADVYVTDLIGIAVPKS